MMEFTTSGSGSRPENTQGYDEELIQRLLGATTLPDECSPPVDEALIQRFVKRDPNLTHAEREKVAIAMVSFRPWRRAVSELLFNAPAEKPSKNGTAPS